MSPKRLATETKKIRREKQKASSSISPLVRSLNKYLFSGAGTELGVGWSLRKTQSLTSEQSDSNRTDRHSAGNALRHVSWKGGSERVALAAGKRATGPNCGGLCGM